MWGRSCKSHRTGTSRSTGTQHHSCSAMACAWQWPRRPLSSSGRKGRRAVGAAHVGRACSSAGQGGGGSQGRRGATSPHNQPHCSTTPAGTICGMRAQGHRRAMYTRAHMHTHTTRTHHRARNTTHVVCCDPGRGLEGRGQARWGEGCNTGRCSTLHTKHAAALHDHSCTKVTCM